MSATTPDTQGDTTEAATTPVAGATDTTTTSPAEDAAAKETSPEGGILGGAADGDAANKTEQTKAEAKPAGESKEPAELEIKLPDGFTADEAVLKDFKALAKEAGLTSEQASKAVAFQLQREQQAVEAANAKWAEQGKAWAAELKADKDFGGDKYDANVKAAVRAINRFGGVELSRELAEMGLGNFPGLVKAFAAVGNAIKEDTSSIAGSPAKALSKEERIRRFYDKSQDA